MPTPWYSIRRPAALSALGAPQAEAPEILIYQDIGENWWSEDPVTAAKFREDLNALSAAEITVRILSMGGSVPDGLGIYNALKSHPAKITTINDGVAASIASLVFMAGDVRIAAANSMLMIHAPWSYASGNAEQLRDAADALDAWAAAMASSYSEATGMSKDEILAILTDGKDHYWTADEALADGFATQIGDAIPAAAHARNLAELQARYSLAGSPQPNPVAAATKPLETPAMPTPAPTPAAPSAADIEAAKAKAVAEALAADQSRRDGIAQAAAKHMHVQGMADVVAKLQADPKISVEAAGLQILAKLAEGAGPIAGQHTVRTIEDETDKRKDAAAWALMARAGVIPEKLRTEAQAKLNGNPFRGQRLEDMARASLDRAGIDYRGKDRMEVVASAFTQSTSDFGILLENAMHKTLQQAYAAAADTWRRFCAVGSVSDFRDHPRYRLAALQNLKALNELGEFENASIPDGERARVRIGTKGLIINLSRQAIINDDLGAFIGLSNQLGRASARTIESDVYTLLALNGGLGPVMDDGKTLFHVDHGNIGTGAALSQDSVDADRVLMTQQREPGGQDFLSLSPSILLVGSSMRAKAIEVNGAEFNESTAKNAGDRRPNTVRGLYADIIDTPRIAGTRRYSFTAPSNAPVLEVDFLDGNEQPFLEQETGFTVDGTKFKVRHDFGVSAVDFRGATTNAGQ